MSSRKLLYLEPVGGIAGDMFLAAMIDLGVNVSDLEAALQGLALDGWSLKVSRAQRHQLTGTHLEVVCPPSEHAHRPLSEIRERISRALTMPERARTRALAVFQALGEAEARIHGVPVEEVHFHEVGAVDALIDICGAAVALELLGDPEVFSAPPPLGSGQVKSAHGTIPVPAPATLELLREVPVKFEGVGELTTPTGAALLKALASFRPVPELVVEAVGYGMGTREMPDRANVLRATLARPSRVSEEGTVVVEANLDDCSPQLVGTLIELLLEAGAVDAYVLPALMKKGRPGHLIGAVVPEGRQAAVTGVLLSESTTLGVRSHRVERLTLDRRFVEVQTAYGPVKVKEGLRGEEVLNAQPEFEDCRALAKAAGVPVKRVWAEALAEYQRRTRR